ncbi:proline--tRNA ligase, partial [Methanosalsum natronophilum]
IQKGIVLIPWCGNKECGLELEERTGAGILGIPQNDESCDASRCTICQKETNINAYMARTY